MNGVVGMNTGLRIGIVLLVDFTEIFNWSRWIVENFREMKTTGDGWNLKITTMFSRKRETERIRLTYVR